MPSKSGAQMFGESFNRSYELTKRLRQAEEEFNREYNFRERQFELNAQLSRDRINASRERTDIMREGSAADLENQYIPVPEGTTGSESGSDIQSRYPTLGSAFKPGKSYLDKDLIPQAPQPIKYNKAGTGLFGNQELATYVNPEDFTDIKRVPIGESTQGTTGTSDGSGKSVDISNEVGGMSKIITLMDQLSSTGEDEIEFEKDGNTVKVDKTFLRAEGKKFANDALTKAGVPLQGDLVTEIREKSGVMNIEGETKEGAKQRRRALLDAIDYVRLQGKITDTQYEALRYWAHIGTR